MEMYQMIMSPVINTAEAIEEKELYTSRERTKANSITPTTNTASISGNMETVNVTITKLKSLRKTWALKCWRWTRICQQRKSWNDWWNWSSGDSTCAENTATSDRKRKHVEFKCIFHVNVFFEVTTVLCWIERIVLTIFYDGPQKYWKYHSCEVLKLHIAKKIFVTVSDFEYVCKPTVSRQSNVFRTACVVK